MKKLWGVVLGGVLLLTGLFAVQAQIDATARPVALKVLTSKAYEQKVKKKENKVYIVMFTQENCKACRTAELKGAILDLLNQYYQNDPYVEVYLFPMDEDKDEPFSDGTYLYQKLRITSTPRFAVLDSTGKPHLLKVDGYIPAQLAQLQKALVGLADKYKQLVSQVPQP